MKINLNDIFNNDLVDKKIVENIDVSNVKFGDVCAPTKNGIHIELEISKVDNDEFIVKGVIKTILKLNCDRCNEPVDHHLEVILTKEIKIGNESHDDQTIYLSGSFLDLEKLSLNEIYLNFPMKVLCKEDCKGICNKCGTNLNVDKCNCDNDEVDVRLLAIKDIFDEKFKEV